MSFAYLLASALVMSAVLGISSSPTPTQMTYTKEDQTTIQSNETAQIMAVDDRSSNLKYVMAIQSSGIWSEIKKRSLTINSQQRLDDKAAAKSPGELSDQELAQLKQACHDGLKCVAVDQLLVLKQVKEPLGDGKVSVRTAITKITQVLTQYTTEYHEDVYQYEAVQQSDDQSKVYQSVTTIVEDNKELCQIGVTAATGESHPKKHRKNHRKNHDSDHKIVNNGTINYNTTKNYNINNGTVNSATINDDPSAYITINVKPHSDSTVDGGRTRHERPPVDSGTHAAATDGPTALKSKKRSPDHHHVNAGHQPTEHTSVNSSPAVTDGQLKNRSVTRAPNRDVVGHKHPRPNHAQGSETPDRHHEPVTTTGNHPKNARSADNHRKPAGPLLMITDGPSPHHGFVSGKGSSAADTRTDNNGRGRKAQPPHPDATKRFDDGAYEPATNNSVVLDHSNRSNSSNGKNTSNHTVTKKAADNVNNNSVELNNSSDGCSCGGGENDSDSDIVSAGSHNRLDSRKGLVEDGFLNNGNMKVKNLDKSNRNKGTIKDAHAKHGIINIGTTNNGPVNYGASNDYTNNGTMVDMDNYDVQQYVKSVDKMYSTILNEFAKE